MLLAIEVQFLHKSFLKSFLSLDFYVPFALMIEVDMGCEILMNARVFVSRLFISAVMSPLV